MNEALTSILLVSDGAVGNYDAPPAILKGRVDGTDPLQRALANVGDYNHKGKRTEYRQPTSYVADQIDHLDRLFRSCRTHRQRLMVIQGARTMAIRLKHAPWRAIRGDGVEWKQKVADDPRPGPVLAVVYGTSESTVKRIKQEAGTNGPRGRPKKDQS
jgi:hypothetical protein